MVISRKQSPSQVSLFLERCYLAVNNPLDILGLTFDSKLLWEYFKQHRTLNNIEGLAEAWWPWKGEQ